MFIYLANVFTVIAKFKAVFMRKMIVNVASGSIGYFDLLRYLQYYFNEDHRNESYMVEKWYISLSSVDFNCFLSYVIEGRVGRISN